MYLRRSTVTKYGFALIVFAIFYCEWFIYILQPVSWPKLKCHEKEDKCTRILFIADPQIQGDEAVPSPLNSIFNFDSDQYLETTFSVVVPHFQPDVLVYLGDLMDEGSIATMKQFHNYILRLNHIFNINFTAVNVWVPGDNDIGGENEPVKKDKVEEFEKAFPQQSVINYKNLSFYKVNAITNTYPKLLNNATNNYRVVVSHYPVTSKYNLKSQVMNEIRPNIYFCAHTHESKYVKLPKDLSSRKVYPFISHKEILEVNLDDSSMYEIYVPTCSYRMGTNKIGYGAAIFEHSNQTLRYAVFWSPTRFPVLVFYLAIAIIVALYILYCLIVCATRLALVYWPRARSSKSSRSKMDSSPLLPKI